jgi:1,4-dihydroxy-2-naphthoate octaprenyltransferase
MLVPGLLLFTLGWEIAVALGQVWDGGRFLLGYLALLLVHLSVSYSNDYFDREGDPLGKRTGVSGGSGVLLRSPELAPLALSLAKWLLLAGSLLVLLFVALFPSSWPLLPIFLAAGLLAWYYSAPPLRLTSRGLGELATAGGVGALIPLAGYVSSGAGLVPDLALLLVPLFCFTFCSIISVELPDIEADRASGKVSLSSKFGVETASRVAAMTALLGTASLFLGGRAGGFLPEAMTRMGVVSLIPSVAYVLLALRPLRPETQVKVAAGSLSLFIIGALLVLAL